MPHQPHLGDVEPRSYDWHERSPAPPRHSDEEIARSIVRGIEWNPYVYGEQIQIQVEDGQVTLIGTVGSEAVRRAVTQIALEAGAAGVNNRLSVE